MNRLVKVLSVLAIVVGLFVATTTLAFAADRYGVVGQAYIVVEGGDTALVTESPSRKATGGATTYHATQVGTFHIYLASGTTGTVSSDQAVVNGSPVALSAGSNTITIGNIGGGEHFTVNLTIGTAANWNTTATWSAASGGKCTASVPTSSDNVYFNANSFTAASQVLTVDAAANCLNMDWTGATNTPTLAGTNTLNIYGNYTTIAAMNITASGRVFTNTNDIIITTGGCTTGGFVNFTGTGKRTLTDNYSTDVAGAWALAAGAIDTAGFTVSVRSFEMSGATAKTLTLGASTFNTSQAAGWNYSGSNLTLIANTSTINVSGTGAFAGGGITTYNNVNLNGTAHTISGSNTFVNLTRNGTATKTDTLTLTSGTTQTCTTFSAIGNSATNRLLVQSSTLGTAATITATTQVISNADYMDITSTNAYNQTANLVSNAGFETGDPPTGWSLAGAGATWARSNTQAHSGTYSGLLTRNGADCYASQLFGGASNYRNVTLTFSCWVYATVADRARLQIWDGVAGGYSPYHTGSGTWELLTMTLTTAATATYCRANLTLVTGDTSAYFDDASLTITGTSGDCGGNTGITFTTSAAQTSASTDTWSTAAKWTSRVPLPQDDVTCSHNTTVDMPRIGRSITFTGTPTVSVSNDINNYGSLTLVSGMTYTHNNFANQFRGRASGMPVGGWTITSAGKSFRRYRVYAVGATYKMADSGNAFAINLIENGTWDLNGFNHTLTSGIQRSATGGTATMIFGTGTLTIDGTSAGQVIDFGTNPTGLTVNSTGSTILVTNSGVNALNFYGGGFTFNNLTVQGAGNYALTITGSNTFNVLKVDASQAAKTIKFTDTTVQTVADFQRDTTSTNVVTLQGTAAAGWGITQTTNIPISLDYLSVANSTGLPVNTWYAGTHSTNVGGNTNWTFADPVITSTTQAASGISMTRDGVTAASINGILGTTLHGSPRYTTSFDYGLTVAYGTTTAAGSYVTWALPNNLTPGATYHYRYNIIRDSGTTNGADGSFTFTMPTITALTPSGVSMNVHTTATMRSNLSSLGVATGCYTFYEWGYNTSYGWTIAEEIKAVTGIDTQTITGFNPNQDVFYRAGVRVGGTTIYSAPVSFTPEKSMFFIILMAGLGLIIAVAVASILYQMTNEDLTTEDVVKTIIMYAVVIIIIFVIGTIILGAFS